MTQFVQNNNMFYAFDYAYLFYYGLLSFGMLEREGRVKSFGGFFPLMFDIR